MSLTVLDSSQRLTDVLQNEHRKVMYVQDSILSTCLQVISHDGLPTAKNEWYKYCPLAQLLRIPLTELRQEFKAPILDATALRSDLELHILNGILQIPNALPEGIAIYNFSDPLATPLNLNTNPSYLEALNIAYAHDAYQIHILPNAPENVRIHLRFAQEGQSSTWVNTRLQLHIASGKRIQCVEEFCSIQGAHAVLNYFSDYILHNNAELHHTIIQESGAQGYHIQHRNVILNEQANYQALTFVAGVSLGRFDHVLCFKGLSASGTLRGLSLVNPQECIDHHTRMQHEVAHTQSNQMYKSLVANKGTAVFNGVIHVLPHAQKTDAYQSSKNMLLGEDAQCFTKPQLEIFANDVKCSHGTSTGHMDPQALFYLQSRGIGKKEAQRLLQDAFALELIRQHDATEIADYLEHKLNSQWLQ